MYPCCNHYLNVILIVTAFLFTCSIKTMELQPFNNDNKIKKTKNTKRIKSVLCLLGCGKSFTTKGNMNQHVKNRCKNKTDLRHKCTNKDVNKIKKNIAKTRNSFACSLGCGGTFTDEHYMKEHTKNHCPNNKTKLRYKCTDCATLLTNRSNIIRHILITHGKKVSRGFTFERGIKIDRNIPESDMSDIQKETTTEYKDYMLQNELLVNSDNQINENNDLMLTPFHFTKNTNDNNYNILQFLSED